MKYKGNLILSTKLLFPQNDENALTILLHSTDDIITLKETGKSLKRIEETVRDMTTQVKISINKQKGVRIKNGCRKMHKSKK